MLNDKVAPRKNGFSKCWEYELLDDVKLDYGSER